LVSKNFSLSSTRRIKLAFAGVFSFGTAIFAGNTSQPNGDTRFLTGDAATGTAFVRHKANIPSRGQATDIPVGAFLSGPRNPEHEALMHLIGTLVADTHRADTDHAGAIEKTVRKWSGAELRAGRLAYVRSLDTGDCAAYAAGLRRHQRQDRRDGRRCSPNGRGPALWDRPVTIARLPSGRPRSLAAVLRP
jgi:hypothetical protein